MDPNLPATRGAAVPLDDRLEAERVPPRRPVSVAFLPFALIVFLVLAFTVAAWTFFTAAY